jgi:hypothetical protein
MRAIYTPLRGFIWGSFPKNKAPTGERSGKIHRNVTYITFSAKIKALLHCKKAVYGENGSRFIKIG